MDPVDFWPKYGSRKEFLLNKANFITNLTKMIKFRHGHTVNAESIRGTLRNFDKWIPNNNVLHSFYITTFWSKFYIYILIKFRHKFYILINFLHKFCILMKFYIGTFIFLIKFLDNFYLFLHTFSPNFYINVDQIFTYLHFDQNFIHFQKRTCESRDWPKISPRVRDYVLGRLRVSTILMYLKN